MNTLENFYSDLAMVRDLQLQEDEEVFDALQEEASNNGLSVNLENDDVEVWGTEVDPMDFEDTQLSIRSTRSLGYYASY